MEEEELELWRDLAAFNTSICNMPGIQNITNISSLCGPSISPLPLTFMFIIQIFYGIICLLGLLGNTLVIYIVLRYPKMHTVTNMYILNLAIADECFLVGIPFLIVTMAMARWPFGAIMCKIYYTITSINQITSSIFLFILSADRYVAVCHPISSPRFRTSLIARLVSLSAWMTSALLMLPVFLYSTTVDRNEGGESCHIVWTISDQFSELSPLLNQQALFTFYSFLFGFGIPLTFILIFYTLVVCRLRSVGPKGGSHNRRHSHRHRQVTKLVLTVITVYILCWLPHWVTQLALISQPPGHNQGDTIVVAVLLSDCLCYSNSAMNPVLYAFLSDNFKKSFKKAFRCAISDYGHKNKHFKFNVNVTTTVAPRKRDTRFAELAEGRGHESTGITSAAFSARMREGVNVTVSLNQQQKQPLL